MSKKSVNPLALELAFYEIYDHGYDPVRTIKKFWSSHSIHECHENIEAVFDFIKNNKVGVANLIKEKEFFFSLVRLLIAYFLVHYRKIKLDDVQFSFVESLETIESELNTKKKIHDFFNRITDQS